MSVSDQALSSLAAEAFALLSERSRMLVTAESCTGGWIAKLLTDIPGSSIAFDRGFVTYSNASKQQQLAVDDKLLETFGAVSEQVALAMATGALSKSAADLAVAVTGIAGPGGGSPEKPVGMVWIAWADKTHAEARSHYFEGDRDQVRRQAVASALKGVCRLLMSQ